MRQTDDSMIGASGPRPVEMLPNNFILNDYYRDLGKCYFITI